MVDWELVDCLISLREEFNTLAPDRDKSSDGSIGDSDHASSSSDHNPDETGRTPHEDADNINEVHAIDVTANLRKSGWTMEKAVQIIVERHRLKLDNRLQNVIYNKRVWSESWGWTEREYTGANPHIKHAHFSSKYTTKAEKDTRQWGLLEEVIMEFLPRKGEKSESVKYWQYVLTRIGYPNLKADGDYGNATAAAVKDFWLQTAKPANPNDFDGSYISGWLGMKMHQVFSIKSVPAVEIPNEMIERYVNKYLDEKLPNNLHAELEGSITFEPR